ncbi:MULTISPECIES: hypothetical protein [Silvimonas]|uniref:hypothetical protein n=1 Tax=Silvimonas TaxID=300264 RepID=UPI0024B37DD2|nr:MULTISPECIES: hypothetical protein [Silvimonas]MDR3429263.1 hypothetical protein [Silvimonas sp.]
MDFVFLSQNVDQTRPLLYLWEIIDLDTGKLLHSYVGKAKGGSSRPLKHYRRNVANLLANKPYRKGSPDGFRASHRALAQAVTTGHRIVLTLLYNVDIEKINEAESREILKRQPDLNAMP